jgi:DNA polymerase III subunit gamma/tau
MQSTQLSIKYRPNTFASVVGQDPAKATLIAIAKAEGVTARSILLQGSFGCGKSTLSRIFGRAVNCHHFKKAGDVCNECPSCKEVLSDVSTLYKEFDATLIGSVEGVKQLVSSLILSSPQHGQRRVVVLDEVHACSNAAQTALLKVLEEGIPNTFFVFCTTHDVIPTIISRSTLVTVTTLPHDLLYGLVTQIASAEGIDLPEDVAHLIVAKSMGHARNAVSILDSYIRIGKDAVASSYYNFGQLVGLAMSKGSEADIRYHLNKVLSYSLVDINFVISEFLRRCYLRQGDLEAKIGTSGVASKFLSYFYQPYCQTALKDERGCELVLLDFISMFK